MSRYIEILAVIAAVLFVVVCSALDIKSPLLISIGLIVIALVPLFVRFERRKPQTREVVMIAVLCALTIAARAAFIWVPHFKPMAGLVIAIGLILGPRVGGLVGAVSAFGSAFIFGLGPWTPWQMLAFSMAGSIFGFIGTPYRHTVEAAERTESVQESATDTSLSAEELLASANARTGRLTKPWLVALAVGGFLYVLCVLGPTLDTCTLFSFVGIMTPEKALAIYGAGIPVNTIHGVATALTLALVTNPLTAKLSRMRKTYGLFC